MIKKISVKNYQSLKKVQVDLGKFTVVFGDSDVGKSALYRAIRGLASAEDGDSFITKGENRTGVAVLLEQENSKPVTIAWIKLRGKSSVYSLHNFEGIQIKDWRRARSLPGELAEKLRFEQIVVDGDKFYPNFRGQFDPLFLLFETPGKRARVLGSLVSDLLVKGIKAANTERNQNEADIRAVLAVAEDMKKKSEFDWDEIEERVKQVLDAANSIKLTIDKYLSLISLVQRKTTVEKEYKHCCGLVYRVEKFTEGLDDVVEPCHSLEAVRELARKFFTIYRTPSVELMDFSQIDESKLKKMVEKHEQVYPMWKRMRHIKKVNKLNGMELETKQNELAELDKTIKKEEKKRTVTCPKCGEVFKWVN